MDFQHVYAEFQPKILRYVSRLVGPEDAEDVAQDVFAKVNQALPDFRGDSTLATWIYRVATNAALDRLRVSARRRQEEPFREEVLPADREPDVEHRLFGQEMKECLDRYITALQPIYRSVFVMSTEEGLTNAEIAEALGVTVATVKIRLHRARQRLQMELRRKCEFSRDARSELLCEPKSPDVSCQP